MDIDTVQTLGACDRGRARMHMVRRFWIEFDSDRRADRWWVGPYAGVTGFDEQDGLTPGGRTARRRRRVTPDSPHHAGFLTEPEAPGEPPRPRSPGVARRLVPTGEPQHRTTNLRPIGPGAGTEDRLCGDDMLFQICRRAIAPFPDRLRCTSDPALRIVLDAASPTAWGRWVTR